MSSRLFFGQSADARRWAWYAVRSASWLSLRTAPGPSLALTRRLMSGPFAAGGPHRLGELGAPDRRLETDHGALALYERGEGATILLQHGWFGRAGQMRALVDTVVDAGFRAVVFDHHRHGASGGREANVPLFVRATRIVAARLAEEGRPVVGSAAHSMGCTAALHADLGPAVGHFMVSPAFDLRRHIRDLALGFGIYPAQFDRALATVERDYDFDHRCLDGTLEELARLRAPASIVHSIDDPVIPIARSHEASVRVPAVELCGVPGRAHASLLLHPTTRARLLAWLEALGASGAPEARTAPPESLALSEA